MAVLRCHRGGATAVNFSPDSRSSSQLNLALSFPERQKHQLNDGVYTDDTTRGCLPSLERLLFRGIFNSLYVLKHPTAIVPNSPVSEMPTDYIQCGWPSNLSHSWSQRLTTSHQSQTSIPQILLADLCSISDFSRLLAKS